MESPDFICVFLHLVERLRSLWIENGRVSMLFRRASHRLYFGLETWMGHEEGAHTGWLVNNRPRRNPDLFIREPVWNPGESLHIILGPPGVRRLLLSSFGPAPLRGLWGMGRLAHGGRAGSLDRPRRQPLCVCINDTSVRHCYHSEILPS